jgi:hypothetical protein
MNIPTLTPCKVGHRKSHLLMLMNWCHFAANSDSIDSIRPSPRVPVSPCLNQATPPGQWSIGPSQSELGAPSFKLTQVPDYGLRLCPSPCHSEGSPIVSIIPLWSYQTHESFSTSLSRCSRMLAKSEYLSEAVHMIPRKSDSSREIVWVVSDQFDRKQDQLHHKHQKTWSASRK